MARRPSRNPLASIAWAFLVASIAFAIIGDPTVGGAQFKANLASKAEGFKNLVGGLVDGAPLGGGGSGTPGTPGTPGSPTAPSVPAPAQPAAPSAPSALDALTVADKGKTGGYNREDWKHWNDLRPCWSVREEVLLRDGAPGTVVLLDKNDKVTADPAKACGVKSGTWTDPYSGLVLTKPSEVDIDHIVPLENAHQSGAAGWSKDQKRAYANDLSNPQHLRATAATYNRQKGAQAPSTWLPIDRSTHCWYANAWIGVKTNYGLTISTAEKAALADMLSTC